MLRGALGLDTTVQSWRGASDLQHAWTPGVFRTAIDSQETQFAVQLLRDQIGQHVFPVHRLDKPTSGLLVAAKTGDNITFANTFDQKAGNVTQDFVTCEMTIDVINSFKAIEVYYN